MMNIKNNMIILGLIGVFLTSCAKDDDILTNNLNSTEESSSSESTEENNSLLEVEDFIYSGMNEIYLYKADVKELADAYFSSDLEKEGFLESFNSPETLFDGLLSPDDRFSFMTDDYNALEDRFDGVSGSTGIKFGLGRITGTNNIFGYLQYILPGTSAEQEGLSRGTVFTEVDGQKLTLNNIEALVSANSFTINTGKVVNGALQMSDRTVRLENMSYTANPVFISEVLEIDGERIGYLMYNSFIGNFDDELNAAFSDFKAKGVNNLVLDLRYNGGGSVESAVDLASMITGQFEGKVFMKEQWNKKYQDSYETHNPENLLNRFDSRIRTQETINSLNLSKVYVLTTSQTASASELVINGLEPHIDVVQIGTNTTGKFQASVTLYDSDDYSRDGDNFNQEHTYAIQPLVFKSANAAGKTDYVNGLAPDIELAEDLGNMGTLGDPSEPLLEAAINDILGKQQKTKSASAMKNAARFNTIGESGMHEPDYQRMYIEEVPAILQRHKE